MKKLSFVLFALVGLMLTTGCKKDPTPEPTPTHDDPTVVLATGAGYLAEGDEIVVGADFNVGYTCTGDKIVKVTLTFTIDDEVVLEHVNSYDGEDIVQNTEILSLYQTGDVTMTIMVTDTQDKTATVTVNFKVVAPSVTDDFNGTYTGPAVLSGTAEIQGLITYPLPADTATMTVKITALGDGQYEGRFIYNDEEHVTTGTLNGAVLVFEPFNREIVMEQEAFNLNLTLTFNFEAVKVDEQLDVDAVVTGDGNVTITSMGIESPCSFDGNMKGLLDKTE